MARKPQKLDNFEKAIERSLGTNAWKTASPKERAKHIQKAKGFVKANSPRKKTVKLK